MCFFRLRAASARWKSKQELLPHSYFLTMTEKEELRRSCYDVTEQMSMGYLLQSILAVVAPHGVLEIPIANKTNCDG